MISTCGAPIFHMKKGLDVSIFVIYNIDSEREDV